MTQAELSSKRGRDRRRHASTALIISEGRQDNGFLWAHIRGKQAVCIGPFFRTQNVRILLKFADCGR